MSKFFARVMIMFFFRVRLRIDGLADFAETLKAGGRVVIAPHFSSFADPVLFGLFLPFRALVIVPPAAARTKIFSFFKRFFNYKIIDTASPESLRSLDAVWEENSLIVLFPEEMPTTNGIMMKLSDAAVSAIARSGALVAGARAAGSQFSVFSRMKGRLPLRRRCRVTLYCAPPRRIERSKGRTAARLAVEGVLIDAMTEAAIDREPIFDSVARLRRFWGPRSVMAFDPDGFAPNGTATNWNGFVTRILVLKKIAELHIAPDARAGIMLPNSSTTLAAIIGFQRAGIEPAMINYSMGGRSLLAVCAVGKVTKILTSRRFVEEGKFTELVAALERGGMKIIYAEDAIASLSGAEKLSRAIAARFARPVCRSEAEAERAAAETALVLFTSGSEGVPKCVALSHLNMQANTAQVRNALAFGTTDVLLSIMPMFHSFGLCVGAFMPLAAGMPIAFYPTPLHYKKIPRYSYATKSTVIVGTNTFLAGYAKNADEFDFAEARYVICGGDKLRESTSSAWIRRFGIRVLEGYGVTEASPVVSVNRQGSCKPGSIGKPLPLARASLAPMDGIDISEGRGILVIKGPNIMRGYIQADGSITPPPETGYPTGDIVSIDGEGYITIEGRAKRFAKIGGEMVSLAAIEEAVQEIWPDNAHAVVSVPDESRGETIMLVTDRPQPESAALRSALAAKGLSELAIPKKIICAETLPRMGVGKTDYQAATAICCQESKG
ncbi:hypothetical protein FACS1894216_08410 [Synergistales bacterium]|nr:hypothetical protein FACS1894216_08410 [Synergistales bacterium]